MAPRYYLGTSGWDYPDWAGTFYPPKLPKTQRLSYLATQMNTVEIDSTFYAPPRREVIAKWVAQVPEDFAFAPKMPKSITHEAKLRDCRADLEDFCSRLEAFGAKLGAVCIQLPPYFTASKRADLETFLTWLPPEFPFAIEFRHASWMTPDIHALLASFAVAWVNSDHQQEVVLTAPFTYIRWLGIRESISVFKELQIDRGDELTRWARLLSNMSPRVVKVYGYANNHYEGHSPETLRRLRARLSEELGTPVEGGPTPEPGLFS